MDNLNQKDEDLAKRFIDRTLTSKELEEVNKRIESDTAFAEKLAFYTAMRDAFAEEENVATEPTKKIAVINYRKYVFAAAATLLAILTFWFIVNNRANTIRQQICAQELIKFQKNIQPKNTLGSTNQLDILIKAKKYTEAIEQLSSVRNQATDTCKNNLVNYKLGMLLLYHETGQTASAAVNPLNCIYTNYRENYPDITIHLARAYFWSGQNDLARAILKDNTITLPPDLKNK